MNHDITELRKHLFETLEGLKDKENPMDIQRAKAIASVAQTIVNTAKVEVDYAKATGEDPASTFLEGEKQKLPAGITGSTVHRIV